PSEKMSPSFSACARRIWNTSSCFFMVAAPEMSSDFATWASLVMFISLSSARSSLPPRSSAAPGSGRGALTGGRSGAGSGRAGVGGGSWGAKTDLLGSWRNPEEVRGGGGPAVRKNVTNDVTIVNPGEPVNPLSRQRRRQPVGDQAAIDRLRSDPVPLGIPV